MDSGSILPQVLSFFVEFACLNHLTVLAVLTQEGIPEEGGQKKIIIKKWSTFTPSTDGCPILKRHDTGSQAFVNLLSLYFGTEVLYNLAL